MKLIKITKKIGTLYKISVRTRVTNSVENRSNEKRSPYEILGVSPKATEQEVKDAFISLSKLHHPDVVGEKSVSSKQTSPSYTEIVSAYKLLSDASLRREYDENLKLRFSQINRIVRERETSRENFGRQRQPQNEPFYAYKTMRRMEKPKIRSYQEYLFFTEWHANHAHLTEKKPLETVEDEEFSKFHFTSGRNTLKPRYIFALSITASFLVTAYIFSIGVDA